MVVTWPIAKNGQKWLYCSFPNLVELCSKVLLLLRYDVNDFEKCHVFFLFFAFFSMKTKPNNIISPHLESLKKGLQLLYHGKNDQKRKVHTLKGKLPLTDYKVYWWTTKVRLRLQSLMIDYKWLEKSDLDYKVYWYDYKWPEKSDLDYKVYW